ncbi:MAG: hypothetical protein ABIO55_11515 [Ginsengibacter sp.]
MPIDSKYLATFEEGEYYHVFNRSHSKTKLFHEEKNYPYFLNLVKKHLLGYVDLFAYCLLPNHFHLFIKIKAQTIVNTEPNIHKSISNQFRKLFIAFTNSINKAYDTHGGLFETPFRRMKVDSESYFSEIISYIHTNPVHHKLSLKPEEYKHSSYLSILSDKPTLLKREEVLEWFGNREAFIKYHNMQMERFETFPFEIEN